MQFHQVELFDRTGVWKAADGRSGLMKTINQHAAPVAHIVCTMQVEQIQQQVDLRTQFRRQRSFKQADDIRDTLAAAGIELIDTTNEWRSSDGHLSGLQSLDFMI